MFVSRFSSGIVEALGLGKPAVYHNLHCERVVKFRDGRCPYRMTTSTKTLSEERCRLKVWRLEQQPC